MGEGAGDIFSLAWSSTLKTIFFGCQNTSLQWHDFRDSALNPSLALSSSFEENPTSGTSTPNTRKAHKFFDSYPQYERKAADIYANNGVGRIRGRISPDSDHSDLATGEGLGVPATNVIDSAHYGYIYCMTMLSEREGVIQFATGSGDETVKVRSKKVSSLFSSIHAFVRSGISATKLPPWRMNLNVTMEPFSLS